MYYSRTFQHQERGGDRRKDGGGKGHHGEDEESISGMLNNFSKALGEYQAMYLYL